MTMIYRFHVLSDENDNFFRDYSIPFDSNLLDFHRFICRDLGYDPENMTSFFTADSEWNKLREFTLMDMGLDAGEDPEQPGAMESTLLSQVVSRNRDRLIYEFDMLQERALYLEMTGAAKADPARQYPAVDGGNGAAPGQFDPAEASTGSIFDEAMSDFSDFDGDDGYDDE